MSRVQQPAAEQCRGIWGRGGNWAGWRAGGRTAFTPQPPLPPEGPSPSAPRGRAGPGPSSLVLQPPVSGTHGLAIAAPPKSRDGWANAEVGSVGTPSPGATALKGRGRKRPWRGGPPDVGSAGRSWRLPGRPCGRSPALFAYPRQLLSARRWRAAAWVRSAALREPRERTLWLKKIRHQEKPGSSLKEPRQGPRVSRHLTPTLRI